MYKIYKITSDYEEQFCYIGKTKKTLNKRLINHKTDYKRWLDGLYHKVTSFEIVKYPDAKIDLIEDGLDKSNAVERERYWISQFNTVNKQLPGRTNREYECDHYDKIREYRGVKITCECGCTVSRRNIAQHKKSIKHQDLMVTHSPNS